MTPQSMSSKIAPCLAAIAVLSGSPRMAAADPLADGFDRMLNHRPSLVAPVAVPVQPADPLLRALVYPLRDGLQHTVLAARPADPVPESFARLLNHQPSGHTPQLPATVQEDPLHAALVVPLRDGWAEATAERFARARTDALAVR